MKNLLFAALLCFFVFFGHGQDTLYMVDGRVREITIVEVNPVNIKFININDPSKTVFKLLRRAVEKIVYADGTILYIDPPNLPDYTVNGHTLEAVRTETREFKRNLVSVSLFDLYRRTATITYEHIFKSGEMGLQVPVSWGFLEFDPMRDYYNIPHYGQLMHSAGLTLKIYPYSQEYFTTYAGFSTITGKYTYLNEENSNYFLGIFDIRESRFYLFELHYGAMLRLSENFGVDGKIGVGFGFGKTQEFKGIYMKLPIEIIDIRFNIRF